MIETYLVHDNGGRPYKVVINSRNIKIYIRTPESQSESESDENTCDCPSDSELMKLYTTLIYTIDSYKYVFVGEDPNQDTEGLGAKFYLGNSILVKVDDHDYISIGWIISRFRTTDIIEDYVSTVGNNDVPYPYAIGTKYTYLTIENVKIPNKYLAPDVDPYLQYYDHHKKYTDIKKYFTKFRSRIIRKREE